jgi:hypothetical protein
MHFLMKWDLRTPTKRDALQTQIDAVLQPYSWIKPLADCYIINVPSLDQYNAIVSGLINVGRMNPNDIYLVITPPMTTGQYAGWLPQSYWPDINKRSV